MRVRYQYIQQLRINLIAVAYDFHRSKYRGRLLNFKLYNFHCRALYFERIEQLDIFLLSINGIDFKLHICQHCF